MTPLLELEGVSKTFGGLLRRRRVAAVRDVSFSLSAGSPEVFTLLGQSGSGKTTLARMILGLETPTTGSLRLEGQDIAELRRGAARQRLLGLVQPIFQNPFEAFNPLRHVDHYLLLTARGSAAPAMGLRPRRRRRRPCAKLASRWPRLPAVIRTSSRVANCSGWPLPARCWPNRN